MKKMLLKVYDLTKAQNEKNIGTDDTVRIYKFSGASNCYLLLFDEPVVIDTGKMSYKEELQKEIEKIVPLRKISHIFLTHLHYDHIGNLDLFENAVIYASSEAIEDFKDDPFGVVLNEDEKDMLKKKDIKEVFPYAKRKFGIEVIHTPGHTRGSVCYHYPKQKILFSGDTLFDKGITGRTDLPTAQKEKMNSSLEALKIYDDSLLCPGHDY